jgi:hypothetical protein
MPSRQGTQGSVALDRGIQARSAQRAGQVYGQIKGEQAQAAKAQRYRVAR